MRFNSKEVSYEEAVVRAIYEKLARTGGKSEAEVPYDQLDPHTRAEIEEIDENTDTSQPGFGLYDHER